MFKCLVTCSTLYHAVLFRYVHCIMTGLVFLMVLLSRMFYTHTQSPWVARVGHSLWLHTHTCTRTPMHMHTRVHTCTHVHTHTHAHAYTCTHEHTHAHTCTYHTHACTHMHVHTHARAHTSSPSVTGWGLLCCLRFYTQEEGPGCWTF